jgi:hypothetical protein
MLERAAALTDREAHEIWGFMTVAGGKPSPIGVSSIAFYGQARHELLNRVQIRHLTDRYRA